MSLRRGRFAFAERRRPSFRDRRRLSRAHAPRRRRETRSNDRCDDPRDARVARAPQVRRARLRRRARSLAPRRRRCPGAHHAFGAVGARSALPARRARRAAVTRGRALERQDQARKRRRRAPLLDLGRRTHPRLRHSPSRQEPAGRPGWSTATPPANAAVRVVPADGAPQLRAGGHRAALR